MNVDSDLTVGRLLARQSDGQEPSVPAIISFTVADENRTRFAETIGPDGSSGSGNDMRCAEAEHYRNHFSFRKVEFNASLSFYQRYKRDSVAVQSYTLVHHTGRNTFYDYACEPVGIPCWAMAPAERNALRAQAQDDARARLELSRDS